MSTPMAVMEMEPVETDPEQPSVPTEWSWTPDVKDPQRLADAARMSSQTSRKTGSQQTDYGEGK